MLCGGYTPIVRSVDAPGRSGHPVRCGLLPAARGKVRYEMRSPGPSRPASCGPAAAGAGVRGDLEGREHLGGQVMPGVDHPEVGADVQFTRTGTPVPRRGASLLVCPVAAYTAGRCLFVARLLARRAPLQ
jgi:hypothetical protein